MKNKLLLVLLGFLITAGMNSCSKDEDNDGPCSISWSNAVSDEITAMSSAAQAYGTDPTSANCVAYKEATQAYLNALRPFGDCTLLSGQEKIAWENALAEAQEDLDDSEC